MRFMVTTPLKNQQLISITRDSTDSMFINLAGLKFAIATSKVKSSSPTRFLASTIVSNRQDACALKDILHRTGNDAYITKLK